MPENTFSQLVVLFAEPFSVFVLVAGVAWFIKSCLSRVRGIYTVHTVDTTFILLYLYLICTVGNLFQFFEKSNSSKFFSFDHFYNYYACTFFGFLFCFIGIILE
jgi:hypothetical protein